MLLRMRYDLGWKDTEIASFTGIPMRTLQDLIKGRRAIIDLNVLDTMKDLKPEDMEIWNNIPDKNNRPHEYEGERDPNKKYQPWLLKKWDTIPVKVIGNETNTFYINKFNAKNKKTNIT